MHELSKNIIVILVVVTLVYFGQKGVNVYLGKQALSNITFTIYSLEDARAIAAKEGKLILADYSAIWCPSCRKLDEAVFADPNITTLIRDNFVYTRLHYDTPAGIAFAAKHDLVGFPRVLVLNSLGDKMVELPLTFNPLEYELNLNKVSANFL